MNEQLILGLTGHPGTGKSTLCDYLAKEHGFLVLEGSAVIKQYAGKMGIKLASRDSYDAFFRNRQRTHGMTWLSDITISADHDRVLQGGLRSRYDFGQIKSVGGFTLALTCPSQTALERIDTSNPKNPNTIEEYELHKHLEESNNDEYGTHTAWCVANADYMLDTAKPLDETCNEVDILISELSK